MDCDEFDNLPSEDSEDETQILMEKQVKKLKEENRALVEEAAHLRVQFENALNITKQLENVHEKNAKLSECARNLKFERDGMEKRLDIAKRTEEELKKQLEDEKRNVERARAEVDIEKNSEIARIQETHHKAIEKVRAKLKKLTSKKNKSDVKVQQLESHIDRVLQNASEHFQEQISDIDNLIRLLGQPRIKADSIPDDSQQTSTEIASMKAKLKKYKKKLKDSHEHEKNLSQQLVKLQHEIQERERKAQADLDKAAAKQREINEDRISERNDFQEKIKMLAMKNDALTSEVASLTSVVKELKDRETELRAKARQNSVPKLITETPKPDESREYKQKIAVLEGKCKDTKRQLNRETEKKKQAMESQQRAEASLSELELEMKRQKSEFEAMKVVHSETLNELHCLRQALRGNEVSNENEEAEKEMKRLQTHVDEQEFTIKKQLETIQDINSELESEREKITKLTRKNEELKAKLEENSRQMERRETDMLISTRQMVNDAKIAAENVIPPPAWRYQDFDEALAAEVDKVAANTLLQPATKLNQIYRIIVGYYNELMKEHEERIKEERSEHRKTRKALNQFVIDIALKLGLPNISVDDVVEQGWKQFLDKITDITSQLEHAKKQNSKLVAISEHVEKELGPSTDVFEQITLLRKQASHDSNRIKRVTSKYRTLKRTYKSLKETTTRRLENDSMEAEMVISELKQSQTENEQIIHRLKSELSSLRNENMELQKISMDRNTHIGVNYDEEIQALKDENEEIQTAFNSELAKLRDELQRNAEAAEEKDSTILKLTRKITHLEEDLATKETEIDEIRRANEAELKRVQSHDSQTRDTYAKTVSDLQQKCESYLADLSHITQELTTTKTLHEKAKKVIADLTETNSALQEQNKSLTANMERERGLNRAAIKSAVLEADAKAKEKIHKNKSKLEAEKQRILMFAFDEFRVFFDPAGTINERSFRELLFKVRSEMKRLSDSDTIIRRLTGASLHQSTDDAVAKILISAPL